MQTQACRYIPPGDTSITSPRTSSQGPSKSISRNCSPVRRARVWVPVVVATRGSSRFPSPPCRFPFRSDRPGHRLELDDRAVLLLGQVLAPLLDVDVVPGEHLVDGALPLAVERHVDAEVLEGAPPELGVVVFGPGVELGPPAPRLLEPGRDATVAPGQDPL